MFAPRILLAFIFFCLPVPGRAEPLTVFAAASLSDCLTEAAHEWNAPEARPVRFNFASSGTLSRQIREGARADLFISADEAQMAKLAEQGRIARSSLCHVAGNQLVLIARADLPVSLDDLSATTVRRIGIGEPATVPAGAYAKQYLTGTGRWAPLESKLVRLDNVRAVLAAVAAGNIEAGFVYLTDAKLEKNVVVSFRVPEANGLRIVYSAAVIADAKEEAAARAFLQFLQADAGRRVFEKHGFSVPAP